MIGLGYKAALVLVLMALLPSVGSAASTEYKLDLGASLPKWAKKIEAHRYRSPWGWDGTKKWLDRTYGRAEYPRIRIVNKPGVKAFFLRNRYRRGNWSGLNVYRLESGEVRLFVVSKPTSTSKKSDK